MTLGPLPLAPVVTRLQTQVAAIRTISAAADPRIALRQSPPQTPAVYLLVHERGLPKKGYTGLFVQDAEAFLQVIQFARNYSQAATGAPARDDMDALSEDVRGALIGWTPASAYVPFELHLAKDEAYEGGLLCRQQVFRTRYRIQVNS